MDLLVRIGPRTRFRLINLSGLGARMRNDCGYNADSCRVYANFINTSTVAGFFTMANGLPFRGNLSSNLGPELPAWSSHKNVAIRIGIRSNHVTQDGPLVGPSFKKKPLGLPNDEVAFGGRAENRVLQAALRHLGDLGVELEGNASRLHGQAIQNGVFVSFNVNFDKIGNPVGL